ncbi:hypothetical protein SFC42_09745, partial [Priestia filamentosa]|uniref:hypothetical protein n=1 Tax=Priestia filamentosa TaxID=1402861 RepID=UPI00398383EF
IWLQANAIHYTTKHSILKTTYFKNVASSYSSTTIYHLFTIYGNGYLLYDKKKKIKEKPV